MNNFPATFIQIHYHYRHGGVKQVIDRYAELCALCSNGATRSLLLCSRGDENTSSFHSEVIDEPLFDYSTFESAQKFGKIYTLLQARIESLITSPDVKYPVAILFHNVSLGKNVAASAAFTATARKYGSDRIRFFSVVHDFAEEGRTEMLHAISKVRIWRKTIDEELHCVGAPVLYVVPGNYSFDILSRLKFPVKLLPNSIKASTVQIDNEQLRVQLNTYADAQGLHFDMSKPVLYCASRIIKRKNIFETVLLSQLLDKALILGPEGTSTRDKMLSGTLRDMARKYRLNILINPAHCEYFANRQSEVVPTIYALSSSAITTSVSEGFGFGLYEPYFYNKPLLGRRPVGFVYPCNVQTDHLYEMLPIPSESIDKQLLIARYYEVFGRNTLVDRRVDYIDEAGILDFADLDIQNQNELIVRFMEDPQFQKKWIHILRDDYTGWPGLQYLNRNAVRNFDANRGVLLDCFSVQNDFDRFYSTFSSIPDISVQPVEYWSIKDTFAAERVSLLL
jgi:hypothetical protein